MIQQISLNSKKGKYPPDMDWPMELWVSPKDLGKLMPTIKVLFDAPSMQRIEKAGKELFSL